MLKLTLVSAMVLALAGCKQTFSEMDTEEQRRFVQEKRAECQIIGYEPDTPEFTNCVQNAVLSNDSDVSRQRAAEGGSGSHTCRILGGGIKCY